MTNHLRVSPIALDLREFDATLPSLGRSIDLSDRGYWVNRPTGASR